MSESDLFDNKLILGDNLLALKALEQDYAGKVKCVFIDPPYNTGSAFKHYDDGIEHSIWLTMMRDRLKILRRLLSDDGSLWITLDDLEFRGLHVRKERGRTAELVLRDKKPEHWRGDLASSHASVGIRSGSAPTQRGRESHLVGS